MNSTVVYIEICVGLIAIIIGAIALKQSPDLRNTLKIPAVWLTIIILLGFVFGTGWIDVRSDAGGSTFAYSRLLRVSTILIVAACSLVILTSFHKLTSMLHGNLLILSIFTLLALFLTIFSASDLSLKSEILFLVTKQGLSLFITPSLSRAIAP